MGAIGDARRVLRRIPDVRPLFDAASAGRIMGPAEVLVSKSQIAFAHKRAFAWVWVPGRYLKQDDVPLVPSLALEPRDGSPRWTQIVEPVPGSSCTTSNSLANRRSTTRCARGFGRPGRRRSGLLVPGRLADTSLKLARVGLARHPGQRRGQP